VQDFKDDAKDAGDMGSGHTVTALYEVVPVGVPLELPGVDPLKYQKSAGVPTKAAATGEWLTAKMRYKHPESAQSLELARPLSGEALGKPMARDFALAAAVAEFGMLLRDSPYKGQANWDRVLSAAEASVGADPGGHRHEFTGMVRKARKLVQVAAEEPGER
jgi:Ca-activated chloride channel family protein